MSIKDLSESITVGIKLKDTSYRIFDYESTLEFAEKHWPDAKGFLILEERQYYSRNICVVS
jgi:hypothetical protein